MNYKKILKNVAKKYNTTPEQADAEIREAIKLTGLSVSPQDFISMCSEKTKKTIYRNKV